MEMFCMSIFFVVYLNYVFALQSDRLRVMMTSHQIPGCFLLIF